MSLLPTHSTVHTILRILTLLYLAVFTACVLVAIVLVRRWKAEYRADARLLRSHADFRVDRGRDDDNGNDDEGEGGLEGEETEGEYVLKRGDEIVDGVVGWVFRRDGESN